MIESKRLIAELSELADFAVTNGGEDKYILDAIEAIRELHVTKKALELACNEFWILSTGKGMPISYINSFMEQAKALL